MPHDLLIAKLSAYNFSDEALSYIYSYLTNGRQCPRINNTYSQLETIILSVPQGFILGSILFNLSINDLFFFVALASIYNFADGNTQICLRKIRWLWIRINFRQLYWINEKEIILINISLLIISKLKLCHLWNF